MEQNITVEVAFATLHKQLIIQLIVNKDASIRDIIAWSNIDKEFPTYDFSNISTLQLGIFGKKIDANNYKIKDNDRIEVYRPLNKTANQKRLERAKLNK